MPTYTQTQLKTRINAGIKGKIGMLIDAQDTMNQAVREVISDLDMRSAIRKTSLTPSLFNNVFEYACPSDLKGHALIDIDPQTDVQQKEFELVPFEQFMRRKEKNTVAFRDNDLIRKIMINAEISDTNAVISTMDTLTAGGGTWAAFGDAESLVADSHNYVKGGGSIKWDISSAGGTTAGLQNTSLSTFDLTDYLGGNGAAFIWVYINSATNLTNFILRLGSDTSNYYSKTITTASDGTAFRAGWNLLRFNLTSLTTTGSPDDDSCDYAAIYMTKTAGKISETDYRFDELVIKKGEIYDVIYYSKYGWQNSSGTYLENSTAASDYLNADTDEFDMIVDKGIEIAGQEVDEIEASNRAIGRYKAKKQNYLMTNPSNAKIMIATYADFIDTY